eukprot:555515-Lingulodinium_polyedra.AAC.1
MSWNRKGGPASGPLPAPLSDSNSSQRRAAWQPRLDGRLARCAKHKVAGLRSPSLCAVLPSSAKFCT